MRRWRPMSRPPTAAFAARASGPGQAAAALASWTIGSRVPPERMTQCELRRRRTRDLKGLHLSVFFFYHRTLNPDPYAPAPWRQEQQDEQRPQPAGGGRGGAACNLRIRDYEVRCNMQKPQSTICNTTCITSIYILTTWATRLCSTACLHGFFMRRNAARAHSTMIPHDLDMGDPAALAVGRAGRDRNWS